MTLANETRQYGTSDTPTAERPHVENISAQVEGITALLDRIRNEFLEMPGLRLTPAQAARLWALDRYTSERLLVDLAMAGFLLKNRSGAYSRTSAV